jgi:hypothetical protein
MVLIALKMPRKKLLFSSNPKTFANDKILGKPYQ